MGNLDRRLHNKCSVIYVRAISNTVYSPGLDDDVMNLASKSRKIGGKLFSDRRVAVFGNSEMSKPGDWVQV